MDVSSDRVTYCGSGDEGENVCTAPAESSLDGYTGKGIVLGSLEIDEDLTRLERLASNSWRKVVMELIVLKFFMSSR